MVLESGVPELRRKTLCQNRLSSGCDVRAGDQGPSARQAQDQKARMSSKENVVYAIVWGVVVIALIFAPVIEAWLTRGR